MTYANDFNRRTHTHTQTETDTDTETDKTIAIGEILQICLIKHEIEEKKIGNEKT